MTLHIFFVFSLMQCTLVSHQYADIGRLLHEVGDEVIQRLVTEAVRGRKGACCHHHRDFTCVQTAKLDLSHLETFGKQNPCLYYDTYDRMSLVDSTVIIRLTELHFFLLKIKKMMHLVEHRSKLY